MFWKRDRERDRYYLLPGQGGRALRRKQRTFLTWSLLIAFIIASIMAVIMYFMNRSPG